MGRSRGSEQRDLFGEKRDTSQTAKPQNRAVSSVRERGSVTFFDFEKGGDSARCVPQERHGPPTELDAWFEHPDRLWNAERDPVAGG